VFVKTLVSNMCLLNHAVMTQALCTVQRVHFYLKVFWTDVKAIEVTAFIVIGDVFITAFHKLF